MNYQNEQFVGQGFSYVSKFEQGSSEIRQICVQQYKEHLLSACNLQDKHLIFLDANVLLGYYQMPCKARQHLYEFLENNKERVYLCDQVQREFYRHRKAVIKEYNSKLVLDGPTPRQKAVVAKIDDFLDLNEDVLEAYENLQEELKDVRKNSLVLIQKLENLSTERIKICKEQLKKQDIVTLLPLFQQLPPFSEAEIEFIKKEFDDLKAIVETFEQGKSKSPVDNYLYKNPDKIFPGIGDIKKKPQSPYGDYFIFHEIMKFLVHFPQEVPIVFLTNDIAKSDWLDGSKRAYIHYLESMKLNTGHIFYILHAEQVFTKILEVRCAHLVHSDSIIRDIEAAAKRDRQLSPKDIITTSSVQELIQELYPDRAMVEDEDEDFWQSLVDDLEQDYEINSLFDLRSLLLENYHLLLQNELERFGCYDQLDALEVTLELM